MGHFNEGALRGTLTKRKSLSVTFSVDCHDDKTLLDALHHISGTNEIDTGRGRSEVEQIHQKRLRLRLESDHKLKKSLFSVV